MDDREMAGIDRLKGLLSWWGIGGRRSNNEVLDQLDRFHMFASDVQAAYAEAVARHFQIITASNDRIATSVHGLLRTGQAPEGLAAQGELVKILGQAAADLAVTWIDFHQQVQGSLAIPQTKAESPTREISVSPAPERVDTRAPRTASPRKAVVETAAK